MFKIGQKVLCIDDRHHDVGNPIVAQNKPLGIEAGRVYTVRWIGPPVGSRNVAFPNEPTVKVVGVDRGAKDVGYYAFRFRALDDKDDVVEIFRQMARDIEKKTILPLSEERLKELVKDMDLDPND